MTHPGGGGNDINLAALWIPVMPETSHMGEEMRRAGQESKRQFEQGFNSGASPESIGSGFGAKLQQSISKEFKNFELPYGASGFLEKFNVEVDKSTEKLKGQAAQALRNYRTEYENLSSAQARATDAENKLSVAREGGYNKASIMLPLIREQTAAQTNLTDAHTRASAALGDYNDKVTRLGQTHESASRSGQIMAGIMGGAIVAGANLAVSAVEHLVEGIAEGFKTAVELTTELAKSAIELGETYEHIGIQIHEFSTASGEDFAKMEEAAQHIFSTLDVAGNDVGKTMAQLASMMDVPGERIQSLVRNVTELQGRFTSLKATDLGATFNAFRVPAEQADSALASLLQSARNSGQDLGQLTSTLSGNVAITLHEAGLDIQQAGAFTADLMKMGEPGRQAMTGMAMAMKEFGKEGVSFSDGMKMAGERLKELGDTAAGQEFAEKLFGTRNWIVAKDAVANYLDIINAAPGAFDATTASTQQFLDQTATLGNKIEEFKHHAEDAFKPFGDAAKNAAINGLGVISHWFDTHHQQIIAQIKAWGDKLIDFLPVAQEWGVDAVRIFGLVAQAMALVMVPVATTIAVAGAGMLALTGHFKEAGHMMEAVGKFDAAAFTGDIGLTINNFADKIQGIKIDTDAIKSNFDDAANSAMSIPPTVGSGAGQSSYNATGPGPGSAAFPPPSSGGAPPSPPGQWFPTGGAPSGGPPVAPGAHHADWDAIAAKESSGRWNEPTPGPVPEGGGLQIKPDTWYEFGGFKFAPTPYQASKADQITVAERILNGWGSNPGQGPKAWAGGATYVEKKQYGGTVGGGPKQAVPWGVDPHGSREGGSSAGPFGPWWDMDWMPPEHPERVGPGGAGWWWHHGPTHEKGIGGGPLGPPIGKLRPPRPGDFFPGMIPDPEIKGWAKGDLVTGGKGGTDDVPALLTKGEYVWDTDTVDKYGWLIKALHQGGAMGFDAGGGVLQVIYSNTATGQKTGEAGGAYVGPGTNQPGYYGKDWEGHTGHVHTSFATSPYGEFYGLPKGTDIRQGQSGFPAWVYTVGAAFGVEASTYAGHQESSGYNRGIDWWPKGHADMSGNSYTPEEKQRLQNFASSIASYGVASAQAGSPSAWAATKPLSGGPQGGDYGPVQYPGLPGQYGGQGVYGGETEDQRRQLEKAVQDANDRKADLDHQVIVNQRAVDDLKDQIGKVGVSTKLDVFGKPYPLTPSEQAQIGDKTKKLNEQLADATHTLEVSQREAAQQTDNITDAQRKQQEGMYKKPSSATTSAQQPHAVGEAAFQALGSSFLSGIGQELGFGDLFSKPPWEWGAVKLLTGVAGWAMGTANAWSDAIISGKTEAAGPYTGQPDAGGGGGSSLLSGLTGSLGINLPKSVSAGPNAVTQPPGPFGPPTGPAPGPPGMVVQGDFQPIHVSPNVDPNAILGPVQEQQNSNNATLHGQTGGLPR